MNEGSAAYKETCRRRENWLRFCAFLFGLVFGELFLALLGHSWELTLWRILIGFGSGGLAYLVSELIIGIDFLEFFVAPHELSLRHYIGHCVENHKELYLADTARIVLTIILADEHLDNVEMEVPFTHYLQLLSAATVTTQKEWFATHRMPLEKWSEISRHSLAYFQALERAQFRNKIRVLIRPAEEISTINDESEIVVDTKKTNAKLFCVPIENSLEGVNDYAIFDGELVITATPIPLGGNPSVLGLSGDPYALATNLERKYLVRLLRGPHNTSEFIREKDRLMERSNQGGCIWFPGKRKK